MISGPHSFGSGGDPVEVGLLDVSLKGFVACKGGHKRRGFEDDIILDGLLRKVITSPYVLAVGMGFGEFGVPEYDMIIPRKLSSRAGSLVGEMDYWSANAAGSYGDFEIGFLTIDSPTDLRNYSGDLVWMRNVA